MIDRARQDADLAIWRWRRRRQRRRMELAAAVVCGVGVIVLLATGRFPDPWSPEDPPVPIDDEAIFVNFGMSRVPTSRTALASDPAEPTDGEQGADALLLATVESDLREDRTDSQFPAEQIAVSATPLGDDRVQVTARLTPSTPESVRSGFYEGIVTVRSGSNSVDVPIQAYLAPREGWHAVFALTLLLVGASLGLAVKWITEALSSLSAARWRLEALQRSLAGRTESLPFAAASKVDEIENRIARQDIGEVDSLFAVFDSATIGQLQVFSTTIDSIRAEIEEQHRLRRQLRELYEDEDDVDGGGGQPLDVDFLDALIRAEIAQIDRVRMVEWPWKDPDATVEVARALYAEVQSVTLALQDYIRQQDTRSRAVLELARRGELSQAQELFASPPDKAPAQDEGGETRVAPLSTGRRRSSARSYPSDYFPDRITFRTSGFGSLQWMTNHPRGLAAAASVAVVVAVGFQLQYVGDEAFDGTLGEWLSLAVWAAVIELSGVSVLDVIGRLTTGRGSPGSSSPT